MTRITIALINRTEDQDTLELIADMLTDKLSDYLYANWDTHCKTFFSLESRMQLVINKLHSMKSQHSCATLGSSKPQHILTYLDKI